MRDAADFRLVLVTASSGEEGARIGRALVEEGLAACVNLIPGARSIYRWRGEVRDEAEAVMLIKTTAARLDGLAARVAALHSYEVPEVISLALDRGSEAYLAWLEAACAGEEEDK